MLTGLSAIPYRRGSVAVGRIFFGTVSALSFALNWRSKVGAEGAREGRFFLDHGDPG